jgi:hypothetical protein
LVHVDTCDIAICQAGKREKFRPNNKAKSSPKHRYISVLLAWTDKTHHKIYAIVLVVIMTNRQLEISLRFLVFFWWNRYCFFRMQKLIQNRSSVHQCRRAAEANCGLQYYQSKFQYTRVEKKLRATSERRQIELHTYMCSSRLPLRS